MSNTHLQVYHLPVLYCTAPSVWKTSILALCGHAQLPAVWYSNIKFLIESGRGLFSANTITTFSLLDLFRAGFLELWNRNIIENNIFFVFLGHKWTYQELKTEKKTFFVNENKQIY